jgi:transcriptional regulator
MYRPSAFAIDDVTVLHGIIGERVFATIAGVGNGSVQFAYAPAVLDPHAGPRGGVRYHLARGNPLAGRDGARVRLSFLGPDTYVSPDWYANEGFVPTWNYIAVEGEGVARRLTDAELRRQIADVSRDREERLLPKPPWTLDKLPPARLAALLRGICGFAVMFETLEGKFKLSQDKSRADVAGVMTALEARTDAASHGIAAAMRTGMRSTPP